VIGLTLDYHPTGRPGAGARIAELLERATCEEGRLVEVLRTTPGLTVACTRCHEYPLACFEEGPLWVCLEGRIHGRGHDELRRELLTTARLILERDVPTDALRDWLLAADGEFLLAVHDSDKGAVGVMNDSLGQLPLAYRHSGDRLVASRHLSVVARCDGAPRFDRMGLAQYLLFRYTLGDRTLVEGVRWLPPGSLLRAGVGGRGVECHRVHEYDFSRERANDLDLEANAREVARLLCEAAARRCQRDGRNVLLLSGGLDSRVVVAALANFPAPFCAVSYEEPGMGDVEAASRIAKALNLDWQVFYPYPATGRSAVSLLHLADGMVGVRSAFQLQFARLVSELWGPGAIGFTGAGGDKVLPDDRPARRIPGADAFIGHVLGRNAVLPLHDVAQLVGVTQPEIRDEILRVAAALPEANWVDRYVHFLIDGRLLAWVGRAFDTYRPVLWTTSPFLASDVFRHAMSVPPEQKALQWLRCRVLQILSPELARIPDSNYGLRPGTFAHRSAIRIAGALSHRPRLWKKVKRVFRRGFHGRAYSPESPLVRCLLDQARNCDAVAEYLSPHAIERITSEAPRRHIWELESLFSVASAIEWLATGRSSMEAYRDENIIV